MFRATWLALSAGLPAALAASQPAAVTVRTLPERPLIERDRHGRHLNFDFSFANPTGAPKTIERIELTVFDDRGRMIRRQFLSATGAASPALRALGERTIPPGEHLGLFNPFPTLPADEPAARLRYLFIFALRGLEPADSVAIEVRPVEYRQAIALVPPVDGPAVIYDGHEITSHHRRIPLGGELATRAGFTTNPVRYANDFSPVGPAGELWRGSPAVPADWYGYGALVRAPGDGEVVVAINDVPDNRVENGQLVMAVDSTMDERRQALGNSIVIRHADGRFSTLAHLQAGSVRVKPGDRVRAGDPVGRIGFSGDTGFHVHVHHMVTGSADLASEGVPAYFDGVRRIRLPRRAGDPPGPTLRGVRLDTGDLFERVRSPGPR